MVSVRSCQKLPPCPRNQCYPCPYKDPQVFLYPVQLRREIYTAALEATLCPGRIKPPHCACEQNRTNNSLTPSHQLVFGHLRESRAPLCVRTDPWDGITLKIPPSCLFPPAFIDGHDVICYGVFLLSVGVSCPSQLLLASNLLTARAS